MPATQQDTLPESIASRLTDEQRQAVLEAPRGLRLAALAAALGIDENAALQMVAEAAGLDIATNLETDPGARGLLPARLVHDFQLIPIRVGPPASADGDPEPTAATPLHLASAWLPDPSMADWMRTFTPRPLVWHLAVPERVHQLIIENFGVGSGSLEDSDEGYVAPEAQRDAEADVDEDAAVVRFVTDVITQAVDDQATDIHFEPQEGQLRIRYRVDGLLVPVSVPENLLRFQDAIISRVKIMARLNISERRLPAGRPDQLQGGRQHPRHPRLDDPHDLRRVDLASPPQQEEGGLHDGPARHERRGAGADQARSSTTRTASSSSPGRPARARAPRSTPSCGKINSTDLRIITIEDPIEYEVPGVEPDAGAPEIGLTFADALRHVLRQDPDVIMVGEIRDRDTAEIAIRASLTGHLVFSTLHTNDAPGAITRLVDMGIEPFLVASAIELVIAQRLVRRLCPECARAGARRRRSSCASRWRSSAATRRRRRRSRRSSAPVGLRPLPRHRLPRADRALRDLPPERGDARPRPEAREHAHPGATAPASTACARSARAAGRRSRPATPPWTRSCASSRCRTSKGRTKAPDAPLRLQGPRQGRQPRRVGGRRAHEEGRAAAAVRARAAASTRSPTRCPRPGRTGRPAARRGQGRRTPPRTRRPAGAAVRTRPPGAPRRLPFLESLHDLTSSGLSGRRGRAPPLDADQGAAAARTVRRAVGEAERGGAALARHGGLPRGLRLLDDQPDPRRRGDRAPSTTRSRG